MASDTALRKEAGYRFGVFEVQSRTRSLLRNGRQVKIQKFPVEILLALLEDPGAIVSREDLKGRLWGEQTFVQFDNSLQVAVAKLREALGETAAKSNFIRTVPGEGYRFVGSVEPVFSEPDIRIVPPTTPVIPATFVPVSENRVRHARRSIVMAVVCILLAAAAIAGWYFYHKFSGRVPVSAADKVVIGEFANATGKPELDGVFTTAFRVKLQESPYLRLAQGKSAPAAGTATVDLEKQMQICREERAQVLVTGQLDVRRSGYRISVAAFRCASGRQLAKQTADADAMTSILPALGTAVESLRRSLGEGPDKQGRFNASIEQATTSSPAAMKAFSLGDEKRAQGLTPEAIADYKLALTLDPQFALAYGRLGAMYSNMGEGTLSNQYFTTAFQLRARITDRERLYIAGHYFSDVTGELQQGIETYQLWRSLYPYDSAPDNNLALQYLQAGEPDKAIDPARDAVRLNPTDGNSQTTLAQAYLALGDYSKLNASCREQGLEGRGTLLMHSVCFRSSFAQNDDAGMQRELLRAKGTRGEAILLEDQAEVLLMRGQLRQARLMSQNAAELAQQNFGNETGAEIYLDKALLEADAGSASYARLDARKGLTLDPNNAMTHAMAALALARAGDKASAQVEAAAAAGQAPSATILHVVVLACVQASIDLAAHHANQAIQSLENARPYDFNLALPLATAYYRGLAYEADDQPQKAVLEFDRILNHQSVDPTSPFLFLARLEKGNALHLSGDDQGAMGLFREIESRWKDADPDFPLIKRLHRYEDQISAHKMSDQPNLHK